MTPVTLKIFLKRTLGIIILAHILPALFSIVAVYKHQITEEFGYLVPYIAGWLFNLLFLFVWGLILFLEWCFKK